MNNNTKFWIIIIHLIIGFTQVQGTRWVGLEEALIIQKIEDNGILLEIVKNDTNQYMRLQAAWKINDQSLFEVIAKNDKEEYDVRYYIIQSLTNQVVIADIALNDSNWNLRNIAVSKLNDLKILSEIEKNDEHHLVRFSAAQRPGWMRTNERKNLDEYINFSALAQTNGTRQFSEAALDYLQSQKLREVINGKSNQIPNKDGISVVFNDVINQITYDNELISKSIKQTNKQKTIYLKIFLGGLGLIGSFILLLIIWRIKK